MSHTDAVRATHARIAEPDLDADPQPLDLAFAEWLADPDADLRAVADAHDLTLPERVVLAELAGFAERIGPVLAELAAEWGRHPDLGPALAGDRDAGRRGPVEQAD